MFLNKKYNLSNKYHRRIVLISDIHYYKKNIIQNLNELSKHIKSLNPDYICITGDLVDDQNIKDKDILINWLKDLSKISKVFISLGNHEFYYNHKLQDSYDKSLFDKIDRIKNVYVLNNQVHSEYGINFIGITLPKEYYDLDENEQELIYFMNKKYPHLSKGYNVLLVHSPATIAQPDVIYNLRCKKDINLILSGHMHAGLTFEWAKKILRGRGIIAPNYGFFKKYCYGIYNIDDIKLIISSGITKLSKSHIFGVFNFLYKSEVVIIDM